MTSATESTTLPANQQPLTYKQWALNIFLAGLPLIGIILLLVWGLGNDGNIHRKSWAKGMLLIYAIVIVLRVLFFIRFGSIFAMAAASGMQ